MAVAEITVRGMIARKYNKALRPGQRKAQLIVNNAAPAAAERERLNGKARELSDRIKILDEQIAAGKVLPAALLAAARIAIDGDNPTSQRLADLRTAVEAIDALDAVRQQRLALVLERRELTGLLHAHRYEVRQADYSGPIGLDFVHVQADTLEEVAEKLRRE